MVSVLALTLAACGSDNPTGEGEPTEGASAEQAGGELSGTLNGGGASSQENAMNAWRAGFQELNPDATVNYDPVGSGSGREGFLAGTYAFAGTDSAFDEEELAAAEEVCGPDGLIQVPGYVSPVAVAFNLEGIDSLNMTPDTIARIFAGEITTWNDQAIAADNPDAELPDTPITVVHRSDPSGTTENFQDYLAAVAPDVWTYEVEDVWPIKGQESGAQTSGVIQAVQSGTGTITYADASQAAGLGSVAVGVGDEFVPYSPEAAAAVVEASPRVEGQGESNYAVELEREVAGTYPIVLVSYSVACTTYDDQETADLVKGFLGYVLSEEGQTAAAEAAGSAPLSAELQEQVLPVIESITAG